VFRAIASHSASGDRLTWSCLALALLLTMAKDAVGQCTPSCGTFLTKWGPGDDEQFRFPWGVRVDGSGNASSPTWATITSRSFRVSSTRSRERGDTR